MSISERRATPCSSGIFNDTTYQALQQEGATLTSSFRGNAWLVKKASPWKGRHIKRNQTRQKLRNTFKKLAKPPVKKLFAAYASHIETTAPYFVGRNQENTSCSEATHIKVASAFILAGLCEIKKGKHLSEIKTTKKAIDKRVINKLDRWVSCSPVRLAYEFLAKNKTLPKGYMSEVLKPSFVESLVNKGVDPLTAELIVQDQFSKCGILNEAHISLEGMLEVKNRIRHLSLISSPSSDSESTQSPVIVRKTDAPSLPPPRVKPNYECDADDLWLIQHTVKTRRTIRLVGDFTQRILRWAQRNKQTALVNVSGFALEILLSGLCTGGIGAAITGVASIGSTVGLFVWSKSILNIRSAFARHTLKRLKQQPAKEQEFDQWLDSCAYLTRAKGVTKIFNAYANLELSVDATKKKKKSEQWSAKDHIAYQKKKALLQLRNEQLQQCFGISDSENPGDLGSYDQLMVETIQEISRLDYEFEHDFGELWAPFEEMPPAKRWDVFNKAANQREVKTRWYETSGNYHQWVKNTFSGGGTGLNARLKAAFNDVPTSCDRKTFEFSQLHNWNMKNLMEAAVIVSISVSNFLYEVGKSVASSIWDLPNLIVKGNSLTVKDFLPKQWGSFVAVWAFYFFAGKTTRKINKVMNTVRVEALHKHSLSHKFSDSGEALSKSQWRALRRESEETLQTFVKTLQELRSEHRKIKLLMDNKQAALKEMSESKKNQLFATILLRRKMIEQKIHTMLAGAIGHMHEETVKAVWHQQQSLKALEVV